MGYSGPKYGVEKVLEELGPQEVERLKEQAKEMYPEMWQTCYPRIYEEPRCGRYYSTKSVAWHLFDIGMRVMNGVLASNEKSEFIAASQLCRYRVPTFWLGSDLAEAVGQTTPAVDIPWYTMNLPFEAAIIMMPKGVLSHPVDGDVTFVAYSRFKARQLMISTLVKGVPYGSEAGGMTFLAGTERGVLYHWNMPMEAYGPMITIPDLTELVNRYKDENLAEDTAIYNQIGYTPFFNEAMTEEDNRLLVQVGHYVFGTLLLMNARPDFVTTAKMLKRVKKGEKVREFWSPNIIGEKYKIRREGPGQGGTHASPRFHWVRGFYRQQAYGPKMGLRKEMWIEPYQKGLG